MENAPQTHTVEMIPLDAIHVLNPRARDRRQHRAIVDNIATVGVKRPITVSPRQSGELFAGKQKKITRPR